MTISPPRQPGLRPRAASWDSQPSRPRFQQLLFAIAGLALLPATAATVMRVLPPEDDATAQLQNLAQLNKQGVLTDEEFAAAKAKILGI